MDSQGWGKDFAMRRRYATHDEKYVLLPRMRLLGGDKGGQL
jgi:hypothetical protein